VRQRELSACRCISTGPITILGLTRYAVSVALTFRPEGAEVQQPQSGLTTLPS